MKDENKCNSLTKSCTSYTKALVEVNKYMDTYFPNAEWVVTSMKMRPKDTLCMFDKIEINIIVLSGYELFGHLYFWYNSDVDELDETPESAILFNIRHELIFGRKHRECYINGSKEVSDFYKSCYMKFLFTDGVETKVELDDPISMVTSFIYESRKTLEDRKKAINKMMIGQLFLMYGNDGIKEKEFCVETYGGTEIVIAKEVDGNYWFVTGKQIES